MMVKLVSVESDISGFSIVSMENPDIHKCRNSQSLFSTQWAPDVNPTLGLRCIFIGDVGRPKTTSEQRQYNNVGSMSFNRRCIDIVRCLTTYIDKKYINTLQSFVC